MLKPLWFLFKVLRVVLRLLEVVLRHDYLEGEVDKDICINFQRD